MDKPLVSVLVPIYNVAGFLRQCVESISAQTIDDIEIILLDDGSTDGSGAIADELASADGRIQVVHKPNSGYGDSLNRGLAMATGEWLSIIEPDDWAEPTMLEQLVDAARTYGRPDRAVDIAKAGYWRVLHEPGSEPREEPCIHLDLVNPQGQPFSIDECPQLLCLHPSIWSALYRKRFLDDYGIRFQPIPGAGWADNPFFVETMLAARSIVWVDKPVYHYREFDDGTLSHLGDWHIIVDRWWEMFDVLKRYDAMHPAILRAHACRGCSYLQMLYHDFDQQDQELRAAEQAMADSLDYGTVASSPYIPAEYKRAYARFLPPAKRALLIARTLRG